MTTEYLLDEQMEHVLAALTPANRRVVRTILHTGLRVGDVLALRPEQLAPSMWVVERKTGKKKRVGLPAPLLEDLKAASGKQWVFPGRTDETRHRTRQAVWWDVKRAAKAFRLPQNIGTHSFRKAYAVELMHRYGDIAKVQRALNHSDPMVTMIYAMADQLLTAGSKRRRGSRGGKIA